MRPAREWCFKAILGLKDLRLAREAAAPSERNLPMLEAVHHQMGDTVEVGMGAHDWSSMAAFTIDPSFGGGTDS